jgi:hypothetical protein
MGLDGHSAPGRSVRLRLEMWTNRGLGEKCAHHYLTRRVRLGIVACLDLCDFP